MEGGYLLAKSVLPVIVEDEPAVIIDVCNNERRSAVAPPPAEDAAPDNKDIDMATATEQVARPSADEDEQCTSAATMTHLVVTKRDLPAKSSKKMASEYFRRINIARRRRETQRSRSSVCCGLLLLVFLLACSVVVALILAGVLKLGSSGQRDLTMAAGGLPSSSSTTNNPGGASSSYYENGEFPNLSEPRPPTNFSGGGLGSSERQDLQAGSEAEQQGSSNSTVGLQKEQNATTLLDFASFQLDNAATIKNGRTSITVHANYTDYIIFENLACNGDTYYQLLSSATSRASRCGGWCVDQPYCQAWTFTHQTSGSSSSGVCSFKRDCRQLMTTGVHRGAVTGIKRNSLTGDGVLTVVQNYVASTDDGDDSSATDSSSNNDGDSASLMSGSGWIVFQNVGCRGSEPYYYQSLFPEYSASRCGDRCAETLECHAWTFSTASGVCYLSNSCFELTVVEYAITGITRDNGEGRTTVNISSGVNRGDSSKDDTSSPSTGDTAGTSRDPSLDISPLISEGISDDGVGNDTVDLQSSEDVSGGESEIPSSDDDDDDDDDDDVVGVVSDGLSLDDDTDDDTDDD